MATAKAVAVRVRFYLAIRETLEAHFVHFVQFVREVCWESRIRGGKWAKRPAIREIGTERESSVISRCDVFFSRRETPVRWCPDQEAGTIGMGVLDLTTCETRLLHLFSYWDSTVCRLNTLSGPSAGKRPPDPCR